MSVLYRIIICAGFGLVLVLSGCNNSSSGGFIAPGGGGAAVNITAGVNPAFDSVTEVATSDTAGGDYTPLTAEDYSYDGASESISLNNGIVSAGGDYVRITGTATVARGRRYGGRL
jgi:hypothetical protein